MLRSLQREGESLMIKIAVLNESTVVKDADVLACTVALQAQVSRDFFPAWGIDAQLNFHPSKIAPADSWQLVILDDSDQADALGYHETTAAGLPLGKAFAASDIQAGTSWTVTTSHELLEMLVDPEINTVVEQDNADGSINFYAKEVCDAVEADSLGYSIAGPGGSADVLVSDFVLPLWFGNGEGSSFDFLKHTSAAFQLAPGGYISILKIAADATAGWQQVTANLKPGGPAAPRGSRRWRRALADTMWRRSRR